MDSSLNAPIWTARAVRPAVTPAVKQSTGTMTTHRGAEVEIDGRRLRIALLGATLLALIVSASLVLAAAIDKNAQINELHQHGVPVEVTVASCLGLLGGSGSNGAGYACTGSYVIAGHRYVEAIPGNIYREPGSHVRAIAASTDPALFTTASAASSEQTSNRLYILPAVLFALAVGLTLVALRRRKVSLAAS